MGELNQQARFFIFKGFRLAPSKRGGAVEAKFHKAKPERKSGEPQILSGRILAGSLVPELKSGIKCSRLDCSLAALVSGSNLRST